jgi:hypothetical protein
VPEKVLANEQEPKSLRIFPDVESGWFLDGELDFGCEVTYANGGKRRSTGYLNGNIPWSEFLVESEQAIAYGDRLLVDLFKVRINQQTLVIKVRLRNAPFVQSIFDLKVPPMESVSIFIANGRSIRRGKKVNPRITIQWANDFFYENSLCNRSSLIPIDSVQIYLNEKRIFDCRLILPNTTEQESETFSLSIIWSSKPWMNDTKVYGFDGTRRTNRASLFSRLKLSERRKK